ncbi:MAG: hypothetical protein ACXWWC_03150 [Chitinophagaceae bacterium]
MTLFNLIGLLSTVALAIPIIALLTTKLSWYKSFPALFFYYLILFSYNLLLLGYIDTGDNIKYYLGVFNNLLDTPLILTFLLYFSKTPAFRKKLQVIILGFVVFEIIIVAVFGFNAKATTIILAPGLLIVLIISLIFFMYQVKIAVENHKAIGKAIMAASLLFAYVGYCFVYSVFYLVKPANKEDAHIVFFLITIFSSIILAAGIFIERKRVQQLKELQTTREELKAIYGEEETKKMANSFGAAIVNFDKEQWS